MRQLAGMMIDYDLPFYGNTPDDKHCAQATMRMVRGYFEPRLSFTWTELDAATGKVEDKATWRMQNLLWMQSQGYDVRTIDIFSFARFADEGIPYLFEILGPRKPPGWSTRAILTWNSGEPRNSLNITPPPTALPLRMISLNF
jgi:hypothetical protein